LYNLIIFCILRRADFFFFYFDINSECVLNINSVLGIFNDHVTLQDWK